MKKPSGYYMHRWLFILLLVLLAAIVIFFSTGCEVFKFRKQQTNDSTAVKKTLINSTDSTNAGSVKKETSNSKEESEWWRVIQQYPQRGGDTTINNFYPQPATIIYEGGKGTREENKSTVDSGWYYNTMNMMAAMFDSTNRRLDTIEKTKHSETKGLGLWLIIAIVVGGFIVLKGAGYAISNFSITKKIN